MMALVPTTGLLSAISARAAATDTYRQLSLFGDDFEKVPTDDVEKPDESKLVESAINGMLTSFDQHSSDMQMQTRGEFGGLGIEVTMEDGLVKVVTPIDDTPASRAGILANDVITQIDGEQVQGLNLNQAVDKMRGPVNSSVTLKIQRKEAKDPIEVKLTRETIIPLGGNGAVRLTTARYYTPSGRSIQAKGIDPDIEVLQDVPDELKGKDETKGETGLRGHLQNGGEKEERSGSSAYVPPDPTKDKQLLAAFQYLRDQNNATAPAHPTLQK
ncbi:S41 family peptidase [Microvirga sp. M2]|uniref:S41 family peptidase n=1 Tax=Microvirga sp. M2 TaxID=3073270 RepID=UPI0039C45947